ncbi:MAG: ABC transporter ATP-binding protein/permease [Actinomycetota bacterium]|nr:ABC transporter ATP-binding protein/permease [Actinomycetota bacterium]
MGHMGAVSSWRAMRSFSSDPANKDKDIPAGTWKRVMGYASPYRRDLTLFIGMVVLAAIAGVATPVLAGDIVNVISSDSGTTGAVIKLASIIAGLAVFDALMSLAQRWYSARIGEGVIYDLRTQVYEHVQQMSIAFFTRAQTGALVSRLNSDVLGAQRAFTSVLSGVISNIVGLVLTVAVMLTLSWQITLMSLILLPVFIFPARIVGQRLQKITRESYDLNASMNATMTERFNVAGAMLVALFGRPEQEAESFRGRAGRVRDIGIVSAMYGRIFFVALTLVASLAAALVYGVGGVLAVQGDLDAGTVVSLALLLSRLYGPLTALSNIRVDVMSALVSFDRVFEVLDLAPGIDERPDARQLQAGSRSLEFDDVHFTYPSGEQVSLASLEDIAVLDSKTSTPVLHGVSFSAAPGDLIALVGQSGAGKTTIANLIPRLYDVTHGAVLIGGIDIRQVTLQSLRSRIGMVTQEAHLFHDTIRTNLAYARPGASDMEMLSAIRDAQLEGLLDSLPDGLDTVVGDRGHRLSGGEKQRMAIARLLLKEPDIVILDEATAHLDSESEAAVQLALESALVGRTSVVIAHRLSTIRRADQILVVDNGRIVESGRHEDLLTAGARYADLYRTQFAAQEPRSTVAL